MLFPYQFLEGHTIYKLQEYIDFLVLEVWCKADKEIEYSIDLFNECSELKEIIKDFSYSDSKYGDLFISTIQEVYGILQSWEEGALKDMADAYVSNNDIAGLCAKTCTPRIYPEIAQRDSTLKDKLIAFFKALFTNIIHLKPIKSRIGSIEDHYHDFVKLNDEDICPFCGINSIKNQYQKKRDAYDHFLPKHIYPFNSINFKNLAPMCHECNSSYKTVKEPVYPYSKNRDPLHKRTANRRKAFYPYNKNIPGIEVKASFNTTDINNISPENIELSFESENCNEEVEAWQEVFGIQERYKAAFCSKNHIKYWYVQLVDELSGCQEGKKNDIIKYELGRLQRRANKFPWADRNFLKWPFAQACKESGILSYD
jgi:hypothetical protein